MDKIHDLDPKALAAAHKAWDESTGYDSADHVVQAIRAYLANSTAAVDGQGVDDRVVLLADRENLSKRVSELRGCIDRIMAKLANLLDEDKFSDCEYIARSAGVYPPPALRSRPQSKPVGEVGEIVTLLRVWPNTCGTGDGMDAQYVSPLMHRAANALEALTRQGEPVPEPAIRPMSELPYEEDRLIAEACVHEGCVIVIQGTNDKPIGWIDTHAWLEGRVYRDRLLPASPQPAPDVEALRKERDEACNLVNFWIKQSQDAERRAEAAEAQVKKLRETLERISCPSQTDKLLWWQTEARAALSVPADQEAPAPENKP